MKIRRRSPNNTEAGTGSHPDDDVINGNATPSCESVTKRKRLKASRIYAADSLRNGNVEAANALKKSGSKLVKRKRPALNCDVAGTAGWMDNNQTGTLSIATNGLADDVENTHTTLCIGPAAGNSPSADDRMALHIGQANSNTPCQVMFYLHDLLKVA